MASTAPVCGSSTTTAPFGAGRSRPPYRVGGVAHVLDLGGQRVVGHLLEADVDVGHQVVAGDGGRRLHRAHHLALGVDLELLDAWGSPQLGLVLVLEPGLPEGVAGLVALDWPAT